MEVLFWVGERREQRLAAFFLALSMGLPRRLFASGGREVFFMNYEEPFSGGNR